MSLILDALRKLDREKSSRRKGAAPIAADILRPDSLRPRKTFWLTLAAVCITAGITGVITYAVIMKAGSPPKPSLSVSAKLPAPSQQVAPAPTEAGSLTKSSPPVPASPPATGELVRSTPLKSRSRVKPPSPAPVSPPAPVKPVAVASRREPVREERSEISKVPLKTQSPVEMKTPAILPAEKSPSLSVPPKPAEVAPAALPRPPEPTPAQSAEGPPTLKISGIVWHEEPSKRRAVINGTFTTEGSTIEGVKVEEIFPTRVRFSHDGRIFEISAFE